LALSFREQLTRFYHKESSCPHPAIVPIEGAVLFELVYYMKTCKKRVLIGSIKIHNWGEQ
jgi:hypothetical protein